MATNPAAKRMSNPTKRNKRIRNKARNEAVERKVIAFNQTLAKDGTFINPLVHTVTAFRHAKQQTLRVAFRLLTECFMCGSRRVKAMPKDAENYTYRRYRCMDCGTRRIVDTAAWIAVRDGTVTNA